MSFENLGLKAELLRAVRDRGYTEPTPIQSQAIPPVLAGKDVMGGAQTGTGKTAGFTLPLLQRLMAAGEPQGKRPVRALILTPTRELTQQVSESVRLYGKHLPLRSTVVYGGVSLQPQIRKLQKGVDILVATPGRLLDHVGQRHVRLDQVEILVLDEADRMLDMGFLPDIRRILELLPKRRQNLLFSATFSGDIERLARRLLHDPVRIQVAPQNAPTELVSHLVHLVDRSDKRRLLVHLINEHDWRQVLIFTNMKHSAQRLADQLVKAGVKATAIHGDKTQGQRTKALEDFKSGKARILVATDVASRGLDIFQLPHVVNYELPEMAENYIHRIGRTGRAGLRGEAVSLVSGDEEPLLEAIEDLIELDIPRRIVPGFEPDPRIKRRVGVNKRRVMQTADADVITEHSEPHVHWSRRVAPKGSNSLA